MTTAHLSLSFEQLVSAAQTNNDYKPVWKKFVRTAFFCLVDSDGATPLTQIGPKDGKPVLLVAEQQDSLKLEAHQTAMAIQGGNIIKKMPPGVAIMVVMNKGIFTIPANLVDRLRTSLQVSAHSKEASSTPPVAGTTAPASAAPPAIAGAASAAAIQPPAPVAASKTFSAAFPEINLNLPNLHEPEPAPAPKAAPIRASSLSIARDEPALDPDLIDIKLLSAQSGMPLPEPEPPPAVAAMASPVVKPGPVVMPSPAAPPEKPATRPPASQWTLVGDEPEQPAPPVDSSGQQGGALDIKALEPRNVVHAALGLDFFVPGRWKETRKGKTILFLDPKTQAKIEVNAMERDNVSIRQWMDMRLPTVTKEMPFLKQVGDSWAVSGSAWRGRIKAMATEYSGTQPHDNEPTHYLICCYTTERLVMSITVRIASDSIEDQRSLYKWLFEQVDIGEPVIAPSASTGNAGSSVRGRADSADVQETHTPPLFGLSFKGRIGRIRFFGYSVLMWTVAIVAILLAMKLPSSLALGLGLAIGVMIIWLPYRLIAMRLHDLNLSGNWMVPFLIGAGFARTTNNDALAIQVTGLFWVGVLIISCLPGTHGENKYGLPCGPDSLPVKIGAGTFFAMQLLLVGVIIKLHHEGRSLFDPRQVAEGTMTPFSPPDKAFTVDLPGKPRELPLKANPAQGVESIQAFELVTKNYKYYAQHVELTRSPPDKSAAFDRLRDSLTTAQKAELITDLPANVNGAWAHQFRLKLPNESVQDYQVVIVDQSMFLIMIESAKDKESPAKIGNFLGSFHLN